MWFINVLNIRIMTKRVILDLANQLIVSFHDSHLLDIQVMLASTNMLDPSEQVTQLMCFCNCYS